MNEKKTKRKIPIVSYLCYLLAVSVLFTGVTLSRYSVKHSADVDATISPFVASYEIDNISSTSITNADFWVQQTNNAQGTPSTVRFTLRNYQQDSNSPNGVGVISDVNLDSTLRLYLPAELADNLVLQIQAVNKDNSQTTITPQYIIGNLVYQLSEVNSEYAYLLDSENNKQYSDFSAGTTVLQTSKFKDFQSLGGTDESLTMSGKIVDGEGYISAKSPNGNSISISSAKRIAAYSVGFQCGVSADNAYRPQLFLDLEKEIPFYTIDINLGAHTRMTGGIPDARSFVLYITLAERVGYSDYGTLWGETNNVNAPQNTWLNDPAANTACFSYNGAVVAGYHYDITANSFVNSQGALTQSDKTKVRIKKEYERQGNVYTGTVKTSYMHVAPIQDGSAFNYIHAIERFFTLDQLTNELVPFTFDNVTLGGTELANGGVFGLCVQAQHDLALQTNARIPVSALGTWDIVSFADMPDKPFYDTFANQQSDVSGTSGQYKIFKSLSKSYETDMNVLFVQAPNDVAGGGQSV